MSDDDLIEKFGPQKRSYDKSRSKNGGRHSSAHLYIPVIVFVIVAVGVAAFLMGREGGLLLSKEGGNTETSSAPQEVFVEEDVSSTEEMAEGDGAVEEEPLPDPIVTILDTSVGFLNVRSGPSTGFPRIDRVSPGEEYLFIEESGGWFHIELSEGDAEDGWVTGEYASLSTFGQDLERAEGE